MRRIPACIPLLRASAALLSRRSEPLFWKPLPRSGAELAASLLCGVEGYTRSACDAFSTCLYEHSKNARVMHSVTHSNYLRAGSVEALAAGLNGLLRM
jgi:hypothetical protein